ncbi:MAG: phosphatidate cytidylyltransferase [Bacteroidetes bacterium]|nr:phosphatidate cytidylyltransferase [Bacteroidota bacterium]
MSLSNRSVRVVVSVIAIPLILLICFYGKIPFLFLTLIIGLVSFYEFGVMNRNKENFVNRIPGLLSVGIIILNSYEHFIDFNNLVLAIVPLLLILELFRNRTSAINNLGSTLLGIFYIGLFSAALLGVREFYSNSELVYSRGGLVIISMLITIWVCDSAAYFLGTAFGKHKLFPRVSPNKSWEGAIAGFVFSIITVIALKSLLLDFFDWADIIVFGVIVGIAGQSGDLIESLIKRDAGVKDSSALIPGHGGIFDRFDSVLYTSPLLLLYMTYFM